MAHRGEPHLVLLGLTGPNAPRRHRAAGPIAPSSPPSSRRWKGGGGSSGGTNTVVQQSQPPQQFLDAYTKLVNAGQQLAGQPLSQYGGPMVAGFSPDQLQAMGLVENSAGMAQPYINSAAQYAGIGAAPVWPNIQQFSQGAVDQYRNPYTQDVVNATLANINQQNAQQQSSLAGNAIQSGASPFGGDRAGIAAAELARNQDLAKNQTIAGLNQQGYTQALGELNAQQQLALQGQEGDAWRAANAAYQLGGLGQQSQAAALQGAQALLGTGGMQQGLAQEQLNIPFEQFQAQQAYPYQNLNFLAGLTEGAGAGAGGTSSTTMPGPSMLGQVAGLGLTGLGLANSGLFSGLFGGGGAGLAGLGLAGLGGLGAGTTDALAAASGGLSLGDLASGLIFKRGGRIGYDDGGVVAGIGNPNATPPVMIGADPMMQNLYKRYASMPQEQLERLSVMLPPSSLYGRMARRALTAKQMAPASSSPVPVSISTPASPAPPQAGIGSPGYAEGGATGGVDLNFITSPGYGIQIPQFGQSTFHTPASIPGLGQSSEFPYAIPQLPQPGNPIVTPMPQNILNALGLGTPATPTAPTAAESTAAAAKAKTMATGPFHTTANGSLSVTGKRGGVMHMQDGGDPGYETGDAAFSDESEDDVGEGDLDQMPELDYSGQTARMYFPDEPNASGGKGTYIDTGRPTINPDTGKSDAGWMGVTAAGLGMLASRSPYPGVAIGEGGLKGLNAYQHQKQLEEEESYKRGMLGVEQGRLDATVGHYADLADRYRQLGDYQSASLAEKAARDAASAAAANARNKEYGRRTSVMETTADSLSDYRKKHLGIEQENAQTAKGRLNQDQYDWKPGTGIDPATNKEVPGSYRFSKKNPDEAPKFFPGVVQTSTRGETASQWKYNAWLAAHPGDTQGALDFVGGHKQMTPADIHKFALQQARGEAAAQMIPEADVPSFVDKRAKEIESNPVWSQRPAPSAAVPGAAPSAPKPGDVRGGYRFRGGDPSQKSNWEPVQ